MQGEQHKNILSLAAHPPSLGPREHICLASYSEFKSISIGEKTYSNVTERTVEANEAGRTEWPSLESSGTPCCPIIQTKNCRVMLGPRFHEQLNMLTISRRPNNLVWADSASKIHHQKSVCFQAQPNITSIMLKTFNTRRALFGFIVISWTVLQKSDLDGFCQLVRKGLIVK